jgi:hypothetical protein
VTTHRLEVSDAVLLAELVIEGARCRGLVPIGCPVVAHLEGVAIDLESACVVMEWDDDAPDARSLS